MNTNLILIVAAFWGSILFFIVLEYALGRMARRFSLKDNR
jgi:hypothetical protein